MRALFAGSFDPVTNGHVDLIGRAAVIADSVVVAVAVNIAKRPIFPDEVRVAMLREACQGWPQVTVVVFHGLIVEAAREFGADVLIRGVRASDDFAKEYQMAQVNRALTGIETLLLPASPQLSFLTSSLIKELIRFGGDVSSMVPPAVCARLQTYIDHS